jgi:Fe-S-cluster-containing hydrogenase component 2
MAYFSNGSAGMVFDDQCNKCKYGMKPCPIALVQMSYNYDAVNNEVATNILDALVKDDGTCQMWKEFKDDFAIDPNQLEIEFFS